MPYYRGGNSLIPRLFEVRIDRTTGLVQPRRGVSISTRTDGLDRFGGAYAITSIPAELKVIQIGADPFHCEIIPAYAMTFDDYVRFLSANHPGQSVG
jgi:hypothetical protein